MNTQLKHTPLPWHTGSNNGLPENEPAFPLGHDSSGNLDGKDIVFECFGDSETVKANTEFIIRSVNCHYEMLDLIKKLNYSFYVDGTSKALKPIMALTKDVIKRAEGKEV